MKKEKKEKKKGGCKFVIYSFINKQMEKQNCKKLTKRWSGQIQMAYALIDFPFGQLFHLFIAVPEQKPQTETQTQRKMVTLMVATSIDPASINPANVLLAMPGWNSGPSFEVPETQSRITHL